MAAEHWKEAPDDHDFPAAESYLSLLVGPERAARLVKGLRKQKVLSHFAAKDILRASSLPLLGDGDQEVAADMAKVRSGALLSPVLLVGGEPLWIADGYHRVCASYHLGEKVEIPCRIAWRDDVLRRV